MSKEGCGETGGRRAIRTGPAGRVRMVPGNGKKGDAASPYRGDWLQRAGKEDLIAVLENASCGIVVMESLRGKTLYINPACFNMTGYDLTEVYTTRIARKMMFADDKEGRSEAKHLEEMLSSGQGSFLQRIKRKDGEATYCEVRNVVLPEGTVVGAWTDVTRRELAEEALKDRETQFRLFFEESFDATILMERSGVIDCNQAALDMLQLRSKAEIIGRTLWEISDQDSGDPLITLARTDHVMKSVVRKKRLRFEWTFRRHNGEVFPAEVTMTATRLKGKKILFMVVRDVTALKGAQRAMMITKEDLERRVKERTKAVTDANRELRKRTSELTDVNRKLKESREELRHLHEHLNAAREEEKTALAREVHDGLGHFLMGLKMELSYMKKGLMPDSPIAKQAASMEEQIDQALGVVSQICSDLRPHVLDQLGLLSAVEWYVEGFEKKTGIRCTTRVPAGSPQVKKEQAIVLFRVLQETMANVLRHSGATMVQVSLKEKGESMLLRVEDNGRGITKEEVSDPQSFGIIGIRERVRFWGGRSAFRGVKDGGTTVTVSIPLAGIRGGSPRKAEPRQRARGAL